MDKIQNSFIKNSKRITAIYIKYNHKRKMSELVYQLINKKRYTKKVEVY